MTIHGWDASDYDWPRGPMDLAAARRAGIDFFTHKSTEGTSTRHVHYGEAMRRARDAGVPALAAYHVVRSPANAAAEVDYCLTYVNAQTPWWVDFPDWFWQVDLERWPYDPVPASEGEQFADIIEARTGRRAVIYASKTQYGDQLAGTSHNLWNANYGTNPAYDFRTAYAQRGGDSGPGWTTYSGRTPAIWQYGSKTRIGSQPTCDANAFRGTLAQFLDTIGGNPMADAFTATDRKTLQAVDQRLREFLKLADSIPNDLSGQPFPLPAAVALKALRDRGVVDPHAVATEVLAVLSPAAIAAAIPTELARQVADELHARLAS